MKYSNEQEVSSFKTVEKDGEENGVPTKVVSYMAVFKDDSVLHAGNFFKKGKNHESFENYATSDQTYAIADYIEESSSEVERNNAEEFIRLELRFHPNEDLEGYFSSKLAVSTGAKR